jgi:rod shape-determining protein MreC
MVQLLTDVKSSISARVERSGVAGILIGAGNNICELKYVPKEEDVQLGDVILTSELGASFPAGIKIGEVTAVDKKSNNLSLVVRIKPYVNTNTVREVLVVRKK